MKSRLALGLLTPLAIDAKRGAELLELLLEQAPSLAPRRVGHSEPIRLQFSSVADTVTDWRPPLLWRGAEREGVEGSIWFNGSEDPGALYISARSGPRRSDEAIAFLLKACQVVSSDLAYLHLLTEAEIAGPSAKYEAWYPIDVGLTRQDLSRGLPELCWATVFGKGQIEPLGRERLLSSPCHQTRELQGGLIYLQLTPSLRDVEDDYAAFEGVRHRTMEHLGRLHFIGS